MMRPLNTWDTEQGELSSAKWRRVGLELLAAFSRAWGTDGSEAPDTRTQRGLLEWSRDVLPHHVTRPSSLLHRWLDERFAEFRSRRGLKLSVIGPRGGAKSTIGSLAFPLRCAVEGTERYIWIVSDTQDQAARHLKNIKAELEDNERLRELYPAAAGKGPTWRASAIELANGVVIEAYGTGQSIRGRRHKSERPTLVICDDLQNDSHIASAAQRQKCREWFHGTLLKAGTPTTNILNLATSMHRDDLANSLAQNPGWTCRVFKAIETWPSDMRLWEEWEGVYCAANFEVGNDAETRGRGDAERGRESGDREEETNDAETRGRGDAERGRESVDREEETADSETRRCGDAEIDMASSSPRHRVPASPRRVSRADAETNRCGDAETDLASSSPRLRVPASPRLATRADAAREFYERHRDAMDAGCVLLWPEVEDLYTLMRMRVESGRTAFEREKQGSPINPDTCEFPEDYFTGAGFWFDDWPAYPAIRILALDPSKGKDARRGDYSAFVMLAVDQQGTLYCECDMSRRPTPRIVADGVELCRRFRPHAFGVESNQFQELLADEFDRQFAETLTVAPPPYRLNNTLSKLVRIRRLGPYLSAKRVRFKVACPATALLVSQLKDFPQGDHDDGPDALEMAVGLAAQLLA